MSHGSSGVHQGWDNSDSGVGIGIKIDPFFKLDGIGIESTTNFSVGIGLGIGPHMESELESKK